MFNDLTDIRYLKNKLEKARLKPQHQLGQNFLVCSEVVEASLMAMKGGPQNVTELGAGIGTLTVALLRAGYKVRAIERDRALADILVREIKKESLGKLDLKVGDLRHAEWRWGVETSAGQEEEPYQLVGNIPYNLSGFIVRKIVGLYPQPAQVVLLTQKEVGERLAALPPRMHLISLAISLWGRADVLMNVPQSCFWPEPKVESSLVMLTPRDIKEAEIAENEKILATARIFFQAKRKQMAGVLKREFKLNNKDVAVEMLKKVNISESSRPQELTVEQWRALAHVLL